MNLSKKLSTQLAKIKSPKIDSASQTVLELIELIHDYCQSKFYVTGNSISEIEQIILEVIEAHSGNAQLINIAGIILSNLREKAEITKEEMALLCIELKAKLQLEAADILKQTMKFIANNSKIFTHSYSGTVLKALHLAKEQGWEFSVTCVESGPLNEGRLMAKSLIQNNIPVTLIADAEINSCLPKSNMVFLGGDTIMKSGLLSKIGSHEICLSAHKKEIPVYFLCGSSKILVEKNIYHISENYLKGIFPQNIINTRITKHYLELVPLELFTGLITDVGILDKNSIENIITNNT